MAEIYSSDALEAQQLARYWRTKEGTVFLIQAMETAHLVNAVAHLERRGVRSMQAVLMGVADACQQVEVDLLHLKPRLVAVYINMKKELLMRKVFQNG